MEILIWFSSGEKKCHFLSVSNDVKKIGNTSPGELEVNK